VNARLDVVRAYATKLPSASEKVGTVGFCWGGGMSFAYAVHQPGLNAAVVYYGTNPSDVAAIDKIQAAVQGHFGGNDARVTSTVAPCEALMKAAGKTYEPHGARVFTATDRRGSRRCEPEGGRCGLAGDGGVFERAFEIG
jgi:carboxymethylenebutenolidase